MKTLELSDIHRSFEKGVEVLSGVSLSVGAGEVVGLLGANGAGKTTLMRIAIGMLHPQVGDVRLFGLDPRKDPVEVKRRTGYVAEDQELPPYLRVRDVIELHRALFPTWDEALAADLRERFQFTGRERISELSKGQARRVALLCAIAHRPELLLLDEPAGGLDPAARREFLETALQLLAEEGSAILFSSHNMGDVERIAGRVCMLSGGRLLLDRDLDTLREESTLVVFPADGGLRPPDLRAIEGCLGSRVVEDELRAVLGGSPAALRTRLKSLLPGEDPSYSPLSLEDLFVEIVGGRP